MADPLDELRLRSLPDVSRELGLSLLEVVRLCGLAEVDPPSGWALDPRTAARLAEVGGVEAAWPHPPQPDALHRVRSVLAELHARELHGDQMTRADNIWRGLPASEQHLLDTTIATLSDLGWVRVAWRAEGRMVSLATPLPEPLQAFLDDGAPPPVLAAAIAACEEEDP